MLHKGRILKDLIKSSSYTQTKVAEELKLHKSQLSTLLSRPDVKDETINIICNILGVDPKEHFGQESEETNYKSKYDQLQEKHISQTTELLDKVQGLISENHDLKNEVIKLKEENLKLRER